MYTRIDRMSYKVSMDPNTAIKSVHSKHQVSLCSTVIIFTAEKEGSSNVRSTRSGGVVALYFCGRFVPFKIDSRKEPHLSSATKRSKEPVTLGSPVVASTSTPAYARAIGFAGTFLARVNRTCDALLHHIAMSLRGHTKCTPRFTSRTKCTSEI